MMQIAKQPIPAAIQVAPAAAEPLLCHQKCSMCIMALLLPPRLLPSSYAALLLLLLLLALELLLFATAPSRTVLLQLLLPRTGLSTPCRLSRMVSCLV